MISKVKIYLRENNALFKLSETILVQTVNIFTFIDCIGTCI